jgi:hypothetical protein
VARAGLEILLLTENVSSLPSDGSENEASVGFQPSESINLESRPSISNEQIESRLRICKSRRTRNVRGDCWHSKTFFRREGNIVMRYRTLFWWTRKGRSVEGKDSRVRSDAVTSTSSVSEAVRDALPLGNCKECRGTGKCEECLGSGVNIHLSQDEPKCERCSGTGKCAACDGLGSPLGHWGEHRPV